MRQGLGQSQRLETGTTLRVDPRVVLASYVLQLNQAELEQALETELNENPALEKLQDEQEPVHEDTILRVVAPQELKSRGDDYERHRSMPQEEAFDWLDLATAETSLWDHLRAQLLPDLPNVLRHVGEYMIECVDEKGYLATSVEEIALEVGCALEHATFVLAKLQHCEPAGIGATSLQECLLLQLRNPESLEQKLARAIVKGHLDELIARRTMKLTRKFGVMPDVVEAAFQEILQLSPYPGEAFGGSPTTRSAKTSGVMPDLVLIRDEAGWRIEVRGVDPNNLALNHEYRKRFRELSAMERAPKDEKRHISHYVQRAEDFIGSLQQRRRTLRRIGEYLIQHQPSFVDTGSYEFLRPLTRTRMAEDLGLHESTISRATMDKFVQLSTGEILSFDVFFKPALRIQKMIEEILRHENPDNPLSDDAIARLLAAKGVHVARRTVNKYRDRTKLLSSRKRRTA